MAKTVKERVRAWRARKMEEGGRSLSAWLEPNTAEKMRFLLDFYGETTSPLVARAIDTLYEATVSGEERPPVSAAPRPGHRERPAAARGGDRESKKIDDTPAAEEPPGTAAHASSPVEDPLLQQMAARLQRGEPFKEMRSTLLVQWLQEQKTRGVAFEEMAQRLNEAGIPTLTGKGTWQAGMISAFLLLSRSRASS